MRTFVFHNEYDGTEIMHLSNDFSNRFKSACHDQPIMENTALFIGAEEVGGCCRRCGKWGVLFGNTYQADKLMG